ncbi:hypothetical protein [Methanococcoides sp. LMO-2]|uniref:Uncharacterized protein n=1 Tax=Methanococcoides cohabitans TaxID=3136559 RepID=A0ABU9KSC9_9EURY
MDIDIIIIEYIAKNGFVRTGQLVDHLLENHSEESGSKRTIYRKLEQMTKDEGPLETLNAEQVRKYGKEEPDDRAKYLILKETAEMKRHLDEIFKFLSEGDDIDKKMVLAELKRYGKKYVLDSSHLDILALNLDGKDAILIESLLRILHEHITTKGIKPSDKTAFLDGLRNLLESYPEGHKNGPMLRRFVIQLLGYYNDKSVLERLKKDIEVGKLSIFQGDYGDKFTAKVIENGRTELFYLENRLRKEGETETADILARIRDESKVNVESSM